MKNNGTALLGRIVSHIKRKPSNIRKWHFKEFSIFIMYLVILLVKLGRKREDNLMFKIKN